MPGAWFVARKAKTSRSGVGVHGRGGHLQVGQVPPPELETDRLPLPAAEREDLLGHRHRADHEAIDGAASPLISRVGQLDHVVGVLGEGGRQASIGQQPRRVVGRRDVGPSGRRQADRGVDPRADPGTLRIDDDPLPLLPREPEVIDIIARRLPLDDHRARDRLGRLERVILFLLGDLRELADGEEEGVGQPVIGLDPDRIDPDGSPGRHVDIELPARRIGRGGRRRFHREPERRDQRRVAGQVRALDRHLGGDAALHPQRRRPLDLRRRGQASGGEGQSDHDGQTGGLASHGCVSFDPVAGRGSARARRGWSRSWRRASAARRVQLSSNVP